ncbi:TPA: DUF853 family protein [Escherichia coli]|nr:DUF853 family protein [Escherichia coli]
MSEPLLIARTPDTELFLLPGMANRHGLITGATGTGKTVTLQKLAESLSEIGVPVFMAEDERNGLINHSPMYGKYEDDVDRESAYEMLQKGFQASIEQQNNPPAKGKEVAVDDGILGGLKDILFGTTGPRGGKKDGVVQTMAKSAARQVTNQIVRGMLGSLLGGEKKVSQVRFVFA